MQRSMSKFVIHNVNTFIYDVEIAIAKGKKMSACLFVYVSVMNKW